MAVGRVEIEPINATQLTNPPQAFGAEGVLGATMPARAYLTYGTYRFINFHRCLNRARVHLLKIGAGTAIVFSDSAFCVHQWRVSLTDERE